MRRRWSDIVFALLVAAALAVAVLVVLVGTGNFVESDTNTPRAHPASTQAQPPPPPAPEPPAAKPKPKRTSRPVPVARAQLSVLITASRGDCWVSAHRGSATGPILAERLLAAGSTLTIRARRIVLELGAAGNVDVSVNGKPRQIPTGTTEVVIS